MKRKKRSTADIDITPLIDVLFMLIIFFVLTTAFVQGSIDVELPIGSTPPLSAKNPIVVTVGKDASILWAGEKISSWDLALRVEEAIARDEDILVAGDRDAPYGDVAELLNSLRLLGVEDVSLAFGGGEH
jgi:biopolymer transport protein ExbD